MADNSAVCRRLKNDKFGESPGLSGLSGLSQLKSRAWPVSSMWLAIPRGISPPFANLERCLLTRVGSRTDTNRQCCNVSSSLPHPLCQIPFRPLLLLRMNPAHLVRLRLQLWAQQGCI
jgi:hypothetical protein